MRALLERTCTGFSEHVLPLIICKTAVCTDDSDPYFRDEQKPKFTWTIVNHKEKLCDNENNFALSVAGD